MLHVAECQSDCTMLDVLRVLNDAERLQRKAARKPRVAKVRYRLELWDSDGNGIGSVPCTSRRVAESHLARERGSVTAPASAALWTVGGEFVREYRIRS